MTHEEHVASIQENIKRLEKDLENPCQIIQKLYRFNGFMFEELPNGGFRVFGSIPSCNRIFRKIHRKPPNQYGNFYGHEKAGYAACQEIIEKFPHEVYTKSMSHAALKEQLEWYKRMLEHV